MMLHALQHYESLLKDYNGRPTALYFASRMTESLGGAKIYLKREDLNHMVPTKLPMHLDRRFGRYMGKKPPHCRNRCGTAWSCDRNRSSATGMECEIFMGTVDIARQRPMFSG
jgi:tryptophan synthase beta chain